MQINDYYSALHLLLELFQIVITIRYPYNQSSVLYSFPADWTTILTRARLFLETWQLSRIGKAQILYSSDLLRKYSTQSTVNRFN